MSCQGDTGTKRKLLKCFLSSLVVAFVVCVTPWAILTSESSDNLVSKVYLDRMQEDYFSKVLMVNTQPKEKSREDYVLNLRFGYETWTDGQPLLTGPVQFQPDRKSPTQIQEFMSRISLTSTPFDTDGLSPYLKTTQQVIEEARRVHFNIFKDLLQGKKYAMLFTVASHENKGDSAITVAEFQFLENMKVEMLFYLDADQNEERNYMYARDLARKIPKEEMIILLHGGGNIFGYPKADKRRESVLRIFTDYDVLLFSQSIYMRGTKSHFQFAHNLYCCNTKLTILLRDRLSLHMGRRLFNNGTRLILVPDMVFQLGSITRFVPPIYDVIWQKRGGSEGPRYAMQPQTVFPSNVSLLVWDWGRFKSLPGGSPLQQAINILENGLGILQKGLNLHESLAVSSISQLDHDLRC